ncbi:hypothetical protein V9T40_004046 [Parthenolecanium corni]|uniref:V-SNARE coiled-coil homology domain-containing protein n=1 Tax=Parthenolecanium corni TaxID=536013 RepID=A0AAN9TE60_9HEMI
MIHTQKGFVLMGWDCGENVDFPGSMRGKSRTLVGGKVRINKKKTPSTSISTSSLSLLSDLGPGSSDGIVGGPRTPQQIAAQKRLQQTQAQVDEVVDIMKTNVEKVLERDQKLSELDDRADALQQGASQFEQQAGKLKRKFWLQNLKMMIAMGVIGFIILGIIVLKIMPDDDTSNTVTYQQPPIQQPVNQQQIPQKPT